jgi:hypothetical protein
VPTLAKSHMMAAIVQLHWSCHFALGLLRPLLPVVCLGSKVSDVVQTESNQHKRMLLDGESLLKN